MLGLQKIEHNHVFFVRSLFLSGIRKEYIFFL